jgi:hypothetical protein
MYIFICYHSFIGGGKQLAPIGANRFPPRSFSFPLFLGSPLTGGLIFLRPELKTGGRGLNLSQILRPRECGFYMRSLYSETSSGNKKFFI